MKDADVEILDTLARKIFRICFIAFATVSHRIAFQERNATYKQTCRTRYTGQSCDNGETYSTKFGTKPKHMRAIDRSWPGLPPLVEQGRRSLACSAKADASTPSIYGLVKYTANMTIPAATSRIIATMIALAHSHFPAFLSQDLAFLDTDMSLADRLRSGSSRSSSLSWPSASRGACSDGPLLCCEGILDIQRNGGTELIAAAQCSENVRFNYQDCVSITA